MGSGSLVVRHVRGDEFEQLRELRLTSLATDPNAFGGTHAHELTLGAERWRRWAAHSELGEDQRTFVLEAADGRWLGLLLVRHDEDRPGTAVLNAMWVAPEARGRGAGRTLCDAAAEWAAGHGCRELTLTVVVGNAPARRAYENAGFEVCGETTWTAHGRTLDELIMARPL